MDFLKKYWPSILAGIVALWGTFGTQIQAFVVAHPTLATIVSAGYAIFSHLMTSPANADRLEAAKAAGIK